MSPQPAEPDLRDRLDGALPDSYPPLDLDAVLVSGRRTVRRRRVGALVAGVAAAAVVAVGATQLVTGPPRTAPQPAQSATTRSATLQIGTWVGSGTQQSDTTYVVTLSPMDASTYKVDYATKGPNGTQGLGGSAVDPRHRVTTWGSSGDGARFVIGLVPSERAQPHQLVVRADRDYGGETSDVEPIPGTGYSAFVVGFEKPLVGDTPVQDVWWFDSDGRPVDKDGRAGASATVDGHTLWLAPDGSQFGDLSVGYTSTSGRPAGSVPLLATGQSEAGGSAITSWQVTALLPAGARTGSFLLGDGRALAFTAVSLGADHSVAHVSPKDVGGQPLKVTSVTWRDSAGTSHTAPTP